MRRFDKKKNIKKANLILETRRLVEQANPMDVFNKVKASMLSQGKLTAYDGALDERYVELETGVGVIGLYCEFDIEGEASGENRPATRLQPAESIDFDYAFKLEFVTLVGDSYDDNNTKLRTEADVLFSDENGEPVNLLSVLGDDLKKKIEWDYLHGRWDEDVVFDEVYPEDERGYKPGNGLRF